MKVYVLHPGYIESRYDHQEHWINAATLAHLYGVRLAECYIDDGRGPEFPWSSDCIHLWPDYEGVYGRPRIPGTHGGSPPMVRLVRD